MIIMSDMLWRSLEYMEWQHTFGNHASYPLLLVSTVIVTPLSSLKRINSLSFANGMTVAVWMWLCASMVIS
jgi:hypothetical protein